MTVNEGNESKIDDLADHLREFSHTQVSALEDMIHKLPQSVRPDLGPLGLETSDDLLLAEIFANHDYLVALARAGFAPPDSPAGKRELLEAFLDAIERTGILPHHIANEVTKLRLQTAESQTQLILEEMSRGSRVEVRALQDAQALEEARTEKLRSDATQAKLRLDGKEEASLQSAREDQLVNKQNLDRANAAHRQLIDEQTANLNQRERDLEVAKRAQQVRILEQEQRFRENLERNLPQWLGRRILKK